MTLRGVSPSNSTKHGTADYGSSPGVVIVIDLSPEFTHGVEARNDLPRGVYYLPISIDLKATKGKGYSPGDWDSCERWSI